MLRDTAQLSHPYSLVLCHLKKKIRLYTGLFNFQIDPFLTNVAQVKKFMLSVIDFKNKLFKWSACHVVLVNNPRVSHSIFDIEHPFHPKFENEFTMNFQSIFAFN